MKKFLNFILAVFTLLPAINAHAEVYHGVNIDEICTNTAKCDKQYLKHIIDDYIKIQNYTTELNSCPQTVPACFDCYDNLAKKIIISFYTRNEKENFAKYQKFTEATFDAYGVLHCQNNYVHPPETTCTRLPQSPAAFIIKQYLRNLLLKTEEELSSFNFLVGTDKKNEPIQDAVLQTEQIYENCTDNAFKNTEKSLTTAGSINAMNSVIECLNLKIEQETTKSFSLEDKQIFLNNLYKKEELDKVYWTLIYTQNRYCSPRCGTMAQQNIAASVAEGKKHILETLILLNLEKESFQ